MIQLNVRLRCEAVALAHETMGHKRYGKYSYLYHLSMVECALIEAGVELTGDLGDLLIAAWLHDSIEDAGITYNDIKKQFGAVIAETVRAVTNDVRGRNRHERHMSVVAELQQNPMGRVLKLADRLANMAAADEGMLRKYLSEYPGFQADLRGIGTPSTGKLAEVEERLWLQLFMLTEHKKYLAAQEDSPFET